jgi:hypothetical protein
MVYKNNIPLATDQVSISQGDLLENFGQLYTCFGTDHVNYDWPTVTDRGKHEFARLRERIAPTYPLPTTGAGWGALYTQDDAGSTALYFMNDAGVSSKLIGGSGGAGVASAYVAFNDTFAGPPVIMNSLNVTAIARSGAPSTYTITINPALSTANYIVSGSYTSSASQGLCLECTARTVNSCSFQFHGTAAPAYQPVWVPSGWVVIFGG